MILKESNLGDNITNASITDPVSVQSKVRKLPKNSQNEGNDRSKKPHHFKFIDRRKYSMNYKN